MDMNTNTGMGTDTGTRIVHNVESEYIIPWVVLIIRTATNTINIALVPFGSFWSEKSAQKPVLMSPDHFIVAHSDALFICRALFFSKSDGSDIRHK